MPYAARLRDFNCSFCLVVVVRAQASVRRAGRGGCRADPGQGAAAAALIRGAAQEAACPACLLRTLLPQTSLHELALVLEPVKVAEGLSMNFIQMLMMSRKHELARLAEKLAAEKAKTKAMASHIVTLQCQFKYAQASMTKKFVARLHEAQDQHKANVLHWHAER